MTNAMKPNSKQKRKRQAALSVCAFALLQLGCGALFFAFCLVPDLPRWMVWLFAALTGLCGLLILPALVVLKQRFDEIEGGESDAAADY
nr:hypothetical protein [uncultured Oscillibacter sp.]